MARQRRGDNDASSIVTRICDQLSRDPEGMHELCSPAFILDTEVPKDLALFYRVFDGAELFFETLILRSSRELGRSDGLIAFGALSGDDLLYDPDSGVVYRREQDTGELLPEGSRLLTWLHGTVEAERAQYDEQGEFLDDLFDDSGVMTDDAIARRERAVLKRDRRAAAPRWRLARALVRQGKAAQARDLLEEVVAESRGFSWAWYDLARLSEQYGQLDCAIDECEAAALANEDYDHVGFFWAHAARLALIAGSEDRRREFAQRAVTVDPDIGRNNRQGAVELLEAGDVEAAQELIELALALAPRDVSVLDVARKIREAGES